MKSLGRSYGWGFIFLLSALMGCSRNATNKPTNKSCSSQFPYVYRDSLFNSWTKEKAMSNIKAITSQIMQAKDDSCLAYHANKIAYRSQNWGDSTLFFTAAYKARNLAIKFRDTALLADTYWTFGAYYLQQQKWDSAYANYNKAKKGFQHVQNTYYEAKMWYNQAYILSQIRDFTGAEKLLFNAIPLFEREKKYLQLYFCYNLLGAIADDLQEYDRAIEYFQRARAHLAHTNKEVVYGPELYNNWGLIYAKRNDHHQALNVFGQATAHNPSLSKIDPLLYAKILDNATYSQWQVQTNTSGVFTNFQKALKIRSALSDNAGIVMSKLHLAQFYAQEKDETKARQLALEALFLAKKSSLHRDALKALSLLASWSPLEEKVEYLQQFVDLNQHVYERERHVRDKFTRIQYETEKYKDQVKILSHQQWLLIIAGMSALLMILLVYTNLRQRAKYKMCQLERERNSQNQRLYHLGIEQRNAVAKAQDEERIRISEELHDGVLAKLFSIRFSWELLDLKGMESVLQKHQSYIQGLQELEAEIRSLAQDLRNNRLEESQMFVESIQALGEERAIVGDFYFQLKCNAPATWNQLPQHTKNHVYRIIEEALQNILRHAKATKVKISLHIKERMAHVHIHDNGKGLHRDRRKGMGMANMKSRTKQLDGLFLLTSKASTGTLVQISFPLKQ